MREGAVRLSPCPERRMWMEWNGRLVGWLEARGGGGDGEGDAPRLRVRGGRSMSARGLWLVVRVCLCDLTTYLCLFMG